MSWPESFTPDSLSALAEPTARRVVELLRDETAALHSGLVNAQTLADELGTSRGFVYQHSEQLGAIRLGEGPKAPLRFDVEVAKRAMFCSHSRRSQPVNKPVIASNDGALRRRGGGSKRQQRARMPLGLPEPGRVLAVRHSEAA